MNTNQTILTTSKPTTRLVPAVGGGPAHRTSLNNSTGLRTKAEPRQVGRAEDSAQRTYERWLARQRELLSLFLMLNHQDPPQAVFWLPLTKHNVPIVPYYPKTSSRMIALSRKEILNWMLEVIKTSRRASTGRVAPTGSNPLYVNPDRLWTVYSFLARGKCETDELAERLGWPVRTVRYYKAYLLEAVIMAALEEHYRAKSA